MTKDIIFKINNDSFFKIEQSGQFDELFRYDEVIILFYYKENKYVVFNNDFLIWALRCLLELEFAIDNKLELDKSMKLDIGYLWNEILHNNDLSDWPGEKYLLWSSKKGLSTTWLYNKNGKIYLEISPTYKWHSLKPKKNDKDYITYKEFIKNYKPIAIIEIDKEVAKKWLIQTNELLKIIEQNDKLYFDKEV